MERTALLSMPVAAWTGWGGARRPPWRRQQSRAASVSKATGAGSAAEVRGGAGSAATRTGSAVTGAGSGEGGGGGTWYGEDEGRAGGADLEREARVEEEEGRRGGGEKSSAWGGRGEKK